MGLADSWAKQWRKGQGVTDEDKELAAKAGSVRVGGMDGIRWGGDECNWGDVFRDI